MIIPTTFILYAHFLLTPASKIWFRYIHGKSLSKVDFALVENSSVWRPDRMRGGDKSVEILNKKYENITNVVSEDSKMSDSVWV